jgi:hypothetical protein
VRSFQVADEVLVFLPTSKNKLLMTWKGPYTVVECLDYDYVIDMGGKRKIFHPNMLKMYHRRECANTWESVIPQVEGVTVPFQDIVQNTMCPQQVDDAGTSVLHEDVQVQSTQKHALVAVLPAEEEGEGSSPLPIPTLDVSSQETYRDVHYAETLTAEQKAEMTTVFSRYVSILTTCPGRCTMDIVHSIDLTCSTPVFRKQYPLPFSSQETIKKEVQTMLDLGVIEPSRSGFSAPVVLVKKQDGSARFCCDYRQLNQVTHGDAEPIPDQEQLFSGLSKAKYFTKIDLTKGYWQIVVKESDRAKTAFQTPSGLFQWVRMPFGLVTAPATFARVMRALKLNDCAINFFDDILIASVLWKSHLQDVEDVLEKLCLAGLTARPTKIFAGFGVLSFLGHIVGQGKLRPEDNKVEKILHVNAPTTKRQVRSLLGLVGYYRKFVPNFASVTAPISDLLSAKAGSKLKWTESCQVALDTIQARMSSHPVLLLADLSKPFMVRTDASSVGIGGILLQEHDDVLHPVAFVSRKLLPRETRYSTIERECLAIVWVITKLGRYLWGRSFTLQTDHRPLTYIRSSVFKNSRVMRWALSLQEFKFTVEPISGTNNVFADLLSRAETETEEHV